MNRMILITKIIHNAIKEELLWQDPNNQNNILVYRTADENSPEGWYSENILSVASDMTNNKKEFYTFCQVLSNEKKQRRKKMTDITNTISTDTNI